MRSGLLCKQFRNNDPHRNVMRQSTEMFQCFLDIPKSLGILMENLNMLVKCDVHPAQVKAVMATTILPQNALQSASFFPPTLRPSQRSSLASAAMLWCRECYKSLSSPERSGCTLTPLTFQLVHSNASLNRVETKLLHNSSIYR